MKFDSFFYRPLSVVLVLSIPLSSCNKNDDPPIPSPGETSIADNVEVISKQSWDQNFVSLDSSTYTITFSENLSSQQPIRGGDIIISSEGEGLLRKVKSVNVVNGKLILQTEPATLTEAITQGTIEFDQPLSYSQVKSVGYLYPGIKMEDVYTKGINDTLFTFKINSVIYDYDNNHETTIDQVRIKGQFACNWVIAGRIRIDFLEGLKEVKFGFESSESLDLQLIGGLQFKKEKQINLATINFTPITVMVGFVPVIFTPELKIILGIGGYANSSLTTGIKQNLSFDAGIQYLKDEGWAPFKEFNFGFDFLSPQLNNNAGVELFLKPELSLEVYGIAGPYANVKLYGKLDADLLQTPWWTLYGGITMNAGAKVSIFDKFLLECTINDILKKEIIIATATTLPIFQPTLTTSNVLSITQTTATCGGNITDQGGTPVLSRGVCWSTSRNPTTNNNKTIDGSGIGTFSSSITGLSPAMTYYVRAYATNSSTTAYGNELSFITTPEQSIPTVSTNPVTNITQTNATSGGNVTSDGGASITSRGVCWSTSPNPTTADSRTTNGTGSGMFTSSVSNLTAGIKYYIRAYATNVTGTGYGSQIEFTTSQNVNLPTLSTTPMANILQTTATSGGFISSDGGSSVTERGVCWSMSQNPTINGSRTTNGVGTGNFTSSLTYLTPGTTYYVRSYATNGSGTAYGNQISFSTLPVCLPTLNTTAVSSIAQTSARCGGNITSDCGGDVTERGVCWSTSQNPTIVDNRTFDGGGIGSFVSYLSGLTEGTMYYVRAYATNSSGTAYGNQVSFTTLQNGTIPTISTNNISNITQSSATGGGYISNDGGSIVTVRGVCWSIYPNPTTSNYRTSNGSGIGSFTSYLTGLTAGVTYYVRAYASNTIGTAYGNQVSFTAQSGQSETVTDVDGNVYTTVTIGTQIWMAENLKTTHYKDNTEIPLVTDNTAWLSYTTGAYCWYNNNISNKSIYGALYNWYVIKSNKLCPQGWHVPSLDELLTLQQYLGGSIVAGGKLKEIGYTHWSSPNTNATNESGFTGLPGGYRHWNISFTTIGIQGTFWTNTTNTTSDVHGFSLKHDNGSLWGGAYPMNDGLSVRCLKD